MVKKRVRQMPEFTKAPPEVVARFARATEGLGGVEQRKMFGYPAAFAGGNMMACVFQDRIMLRLSPSDRAAALALPGAKLFEPMPGRPMKEYVELPASTKPADFAKWVDRSLAYVKSLPPR